MSGKQEKKIGDYSTVDINNLFNTPIKQSKQKRIKKTKDVVNPVFMEMAEIIDDVQWKTLFTKAANGKFPQGFTCKSSVLYYRKKSKVEKLDLSCSMDMVLPQVIEFFRLYGGFSNENQYVNIFDYLTTNVCEYSSWQQIRPKNVKESFIDEYIKKLEKNYELNGFEILRLRDLLNLSFSTKKIDHKNVVFENMAIQDINNLFWNPQKRVFHVDGTPVIKPTARKKQTVNKQSMLYHWLSYNGLNDIEIEKILKTPALVNHP